jgi:hypothetical protein
MSIKIGVAIVSDHKAGNLVSLLGVRENVCRGCNTTSYDVYANFK